nr:hypothetical protein [Tanacetum cinerariifolium]
MLSRISFHVLIRQNSFLASIRFYKFPPRWGNDPGENPLIDHHCCYVCGNSLNDFFCYQCTCEFCGNGAHVGYNCPAQVPSFQTLPSFPQQYPYCEDYGVFPEADHCQPPQLAVNHPIFNAYNDLLGSGTTLMEQMEQLTSMCEMFCQFIQKKQEEKQLEEEQTAKAQNWKLPSCVENLVPIPSESESGSECDMPVSFTTFSNVLFNADYDFDSGDDQSFFGEDFSKKIFSNPLFDEEIIFMMIDPHPLNVESDFIESMPNHDSSIIISSKIDSLFDEFAGELTLLKSISPRIDETDCHPEEETHFTKRLLYDNSSPRPPKEIVSDNSNANIESFSPYPIPNEDSDSRMEEIDLSLNPDDPMPSSIEDDDHDSKRDIPILEELLDNYSLSLPDNESYHFDIPSPIVLL